MSLVLLRLTHTTGMRPVRCSLEVYHAVNAGKGRAVTLVAMGIELLLGKDVTTVLERRARQLKFYRER